MTVDQQEPHAEGTNDPPSERSRLAAMIVLQLHQRQDPDGPKPTMEDIWAWIHGELDETRSAEVKSHIARDPDIYSLWHELRTTRSEVETMSMLAESGEATHRDHSIKSQSEVDLERNDEGYNPHRLSASSGWNLAAFVQTVRNWMQPKPMVGFATAAIVGSIFVKIMQPTQNIDYWQDWQTPKSNATAAFFIKDAGALQSVLAGMNTAMRELSIPALGPDGMPLPRTPPACEAPTDNAECIATRKALHELGQLVVEVRLICLTRYPIPDSKFERLSTLADVLVGTADGRPFESPINDWLESKEDRGRCAAANIIVERALRGLAS